MELAAGGPVLLVAAYWRTNLTLRQLAPLFGISKSAAGRIIDHVAPSLALQPRQRFRKNSVLVVDGPLVRGRGGGYPQGRRPDVPGDGAASPQS
jgi:hypothetical protein